MKRGAVLLAAALTACGGAPAPDTARQAPASTARVEQGALFSTVSLNGTLTRRARSDGSPYTAINQARGIYTRLPEVGAKVDCGDVLYRVDDNPVRLLCGTVPAYRDLNTGDRGKDVRQLNRNLRVRGNVFTVKTKAALKRLQRGKGRLDLDDAVFLPSPIRITKLSGKLGAPARPGAPVAQATSDTLEVQVELEPSQQRQVKRGDSARITLPDNTSVDGTVDRLGRVARTPEGADHATIPASIRLDEPEQARGLDEAPVRVEVTTTGVKDALSVPVTALVGRSGGGFAVEVVRDRRRRELVAVQLGLFDTASGRVEVEGALKAGDEVVVPSL
ncbi:hypothetical protein DVA67_026710 [Solirubrobacter sp. CPCC 204708]|uniref:HlyD family efflux transporter periplasmic adaptor subunit n=1 Tax=Solirubrobacter deserti TaxID=2282478 RepID=A0ABT4RGK4_9ACTN|nr:hypothetical protein [Solirubrobacter deserti]MBE2319588.1 hypothetical protein [Solirubrobacter deserti]MDA0137673.1 hypothetical protein [Solirubrobacter deserti]